MNPIATLFVEIGADLSGLKKGMDNAVNEAKQGAGGIAGAFKNALGGLGDMVGNVLQAGLAAALAGVVALGAGIAGLSAIVNSALDATSKWGGQLDTLGDTLGLSGEAASTFAVAMNRVGLSVDEGAAGLNFFTRGLSDLGEAAKEPTVSIKDNSAAIEKLNEQLETAETRLQRAQIRMASAKKPTVSMQWAVDDAREAIDKLNEKLAKTPASITSVSKAAAKVTPFGVALDKLGISAKDAQGNLKPFEMIMPEIMDAFKQLPAGVDATALAMDLFGARGGTKFLDFLRSGSLGLEDAKKMADEFGLSLSTEASDAIEQFGFAQNELNLAMQGFGVQIGVAVMPVLKDLIKFLSGSVVPAFTAFVKDVLPGIVQGFADLGGAVAGFFDSIKGESLGGIASILLSGLGLSGEAAAAVGNFVQQVVTAITQGFGAAQAWLTTNGPLIVAQAIGIGQGILDWFTVNGPLMFADAISAVEFFGARVSEAFFKVPQDANASKTQLQTALLAWQGVMDLMAPRFQIVQDKIKAGWDAIGAAIKRATNDKPIVDFNNSLDAWAIKLPDSVQLFTEFAIGMENLANDIAEVLNGIAAAIDAIARAAKNARDFFGGGAGGTNPPPPPPTIPGDTFGGGAPFPITNERAGVTVNLTYAPVVSLMDEAEAETKLNPFVRAAVQAAMAS